MFHPRDVTMTFGMLRAGSHAINDLQLPKRSRRVDWPFQNIRIRKDLIQSERSNSGYAPYCNDFRDILLSFFDFSFITINGIYIEGKNKIKTTL